MKKTPFLICYLILIVACNQEAQDTSVDVPASETYEEETPKYTYFTDKKEGGKLEFYRVINKTGTVQKRNRGGYWDNER
jgi:hypothetical protein